MPHRNRSSRNDSTFDVVREPLDVVAAHILIDGLYSPWMLIPHELLMLGGGNGQDEAAVVLEECSKPVMYEGARRSRKMLVYIEQNYGVDFTLNFVLDEVADLEA
jgi:hypothetical protein